MTEMPEYGLDNAWRSARDRLTALEEWLDPATRRLLEACGLRPGWACLEIGAGGGSIAAWLSERTGPDGMVLATDIDTRFVGRMEAPNLRVLAHDIAAEDLPEVGFDLVHCRLVLAHLGDRERALAGMIAALRPGGVLVAEEMDFVSVTASVPGTDGAVFADAAMAHEIVLSRHGFDPYYGRRLDAELRRAGLGDVGTEGHVRLCPGGSPPARAWRLTFEQLREEMLATGLAAADLDHAGRLCDDPGFSFMSQLTMAAWGRRPPDPPR